MVTERHCRRKQFCFLVWVCSLGSIIQHLLAASQASNSCRTHGFPSAWLLQFTVPIVTQKPAPTASNLIRQFCREYLWWDTSLWKAFPGILLSGFPASSAITIAISLPFSESQLCSLQQGLDHISGGEGTLPWELYISPLSGGILYYVILYYIIYYII